MTPASKTPVFFIAITLIFLGVMTYLGVRTLKHEALLLHYQSETLAQTRAEQAKEWVMHILAQKSTRLEAIAGVMQFDEPSIHALIEQDSDIEDVFVLQKNTLIYPKERAGATFLSPKNDLWQQTILPFVYDPSLLYKHSEKNESAQPSEAGAGWFIAKETQAPVLIYWQKKGGVILGFRLSYTKLLSDVINAASFDFGEDALVLTENGRILYQSREVKLAELADLANLANLTSAQPSDNQQRLASLPLAYPLIGWQVDYFGQQPSSLPLYLWGGLALFVVMALAGLVILRLYAEYTRTAREAREQVNFVGQVSHEFKTPLTNITLYAELLKEALEELNEAGEADEQTVHYVAVILSESQRLSRLIQNILSFTRAPKMHFRPVELTALLAHIADTFTPSFQTKGMHINWRTAEPITVMSDVDGLTQILANFLNNAEKYAASGKMVDLFLTVTPDAVAIHVRDYGPGIAEKEAQKIFLPFYRIRSVTRLSITEGVAGTGIGLTIAKQLADSLHGEILLSHPTPGAQFTLRLTREAR